MFDDAYLRKLLKLAEKFARRKQHPNDAEDFAQYAVMEILKGRTASFAQLLADFLRETYGDSRCKNHMWPSRFAIIDSKFVDKKDDFREADARKDANAYMDRLPLKDRILIKLAYIYDLDNEKIADCFGVSESRISQHLSRIRVALKSLSRKEKLPRALAGKKSRKSIRTWEKSLGETYSKAEGYDYRTAQREISQRKLEKNRDARQGSARAEDEKMAAREPRALESYREIVYEEWLT